MTTQITIADYWAGRDLSFAADLTEEIRQNAEQTVTKVNLLLFIAVKAGVPLISTNKNNLVNSGWRPPAINAATPGAAPLSRHMTGQAVDVSDPESSLAFWCLANPAELEALGIWQENPAYTVGWCHLQTVAPRSGRRVFIP